MPIYLTPDPGDSLEAMTLMLAAITWPECLPDGREFAEAHCALMGHMYRVIALAEPAWEQRRQRVKPGFLLMDVDRINKLVKLTANRLQQALVAARVVRPFIADVVLADPPDLPSAVASLSLNAIVPYVLGDEGPPDTHNFEQRVVRRSLPILHLAVALERAIGLFEQDHDTAPSLEALAVQPGLVTWLANEAQSLEETLLAVRKFTVPPEGQVRFRLAG